MPSSSRSSSHSSSDYELLITEKDPQPSPPSPPLPPILSWFAGVSRPTPTVSQMRNRRALERENTKRVGFLGALFGARAVEGRLVKKDKKSTGDESKAGGEGDEEGSADAEDGGKSADDKEEEASGTTTGEGGASNGSEAGKAATASGAGAEKTGGDETVGGNVRNGKVAELTCAGRSRVKRKESEQVAFKNESKWYIDGLFKRRKLAQTPKPSRNKGSGEPPQIPDDGWLTVATITKAEDNEDNPLLCMSGALGN